MRDDTPAQAAARLRAALGPIGASARRARRRDVGRARRRPRPDARPGRAHALVRHVRARRRHPRRDRPRRRSAATASARSVAYLAAELTKRGYGPATLALDGMPRYDIGGGGREITGDPLQFVLVATGRADAATIGLDPSVNIYAE